MAGYFETFAKMHNEKLPNDSEQRFDLFDDGMSFRERNEYHKRKIDEVLRAEVPELYRKCR